jgi:hypothetical protein
MSVFASAIVDVLRPSTPKGLGLFRVECWGRAPHDYVRTYEIQAKTDTIAAQEGIRRFVADIEGLLAKQQGEGN